MTFSLILLGTDTDYKAYQTYPKGGLLDLVYDAMHSPKALVEGPDTYANNKGEKIAKATLHLLEALKRDEKQLLIAGHSRGAIEAILVAHELKNIMQRMQSGWSLSEALLTTPCHQTRKAYQHSKEIIDSVGSLKIKQIANHKIALFLIDPVPGGNYMGFKTGWPDVRMYALPENVEVCEAIYMENERTCAFKAAIPKVLSKEATQFHPYTLPGNHGSAVGSPYDQKGRAPKGWYPRFENELPPMILSMHVAFLHLYNFFNRYQVIFNFKKIKNRAEFEDRESLAKFVIDYIDVKTDQRQVLLDTYEKIQNHKRHFESLNLVGYSSLGVEGGNKRIVHYHSKLNNTYLQDIPGLMPPSGFVNTRHFAIFEQQFYNELEKLAEDELVVGQLDEIQDAELINAAIRLSKISKTLINYIISGEEEKKDGGMFGFLRKKAVVSNKLFKKKAHHYLNISVDNLVQLFMSIDRAISTKIKAIEILQAMLNDLHQLTQGLQQKAHPAISLLNNLKSKMSLGIRARIDLHVYELSKGINELDSQYSIASINTLNCYHSEALMLLASIKQLQAIGYFNESFKKYCHGVTQNIQFQVQDLEARIHESQMPVHLAKDHTQLSKMQKIAKIKLIETAVQKYKAWMLENATGCRVMNFLVCKKMHIFHGASGHNRANMLLNIIENHSLTSVNANEEDMNHFFNLVKTAMTASGIQKHSLSRYIYQQLSPEADSNAYDTPGYNSLRFAYAKRQLKI